MFLISKKVQVCEKPTYNSIKIVDISLACEYHLNNKFMPGPSPLLSWLMQRLIQGDFETVQWIGIPYFYPN